MSAADVPPTVAQGPRVTAAAVACARVVADVVEIAAGAGRRDALLAMARAHGAELAPFGRATLHASQLLLCVRPERWLILSRAAAAGATAQDWRLACGGAAAVIDQSSGLELLHLSSPAARELLARSCRLDLDPARFPVGAAAATLLAQVQVTIASLPSGLLLLTPASTSRHLREWLASAAAGISLTLQTDISLSTLLMKETI